MIGSFARRSTLIALALVPALAIAAPRGKKKKKTRKQATTTAPAEPAEPSEPPDPESTAPPTDAKTPGTVTVTPATAPAMPATDGAEAGSGAGAASAEPAADKPDANDPDVDSLRQEYLSLRDELFRSRARANTIASQLYSTRIQIKLTYTTARFYNPAKAAIRLDGANVYDNATGAIGGDDGIRFDGYVAPGRHLITFRVEATGKDDDSFSSVTENQIVVKAVAGKDLVVAAKARDAGDIAYEWKRKERGSYGLGIDVAVKTVPRDHGAKK